MADPQAPRRVGLVWAEGHGGAIGRGGQMPWHLPEDLAHFKRVTMGAPVIMGRRTWESLPERFRPLPGRENVVVSRDSAFVAPGARVVASAEAALGLFTGTVWVIGGEVLFRAVMPEATELVVTRIDVEVPDADTFAPRIGADWRLAEASEPLVSSTGLGYRFERYVRASAPGEGA